MNPVDCPHSERKEGEVRGTTVIVPEGVCFCTVSPVSGVWFSVGAGWERRVEVLPVEDGQRVLGLPFTHSPGFRAPVECRNVPLPQVYPSVQVH